MEPSLTDQYETLRAQQAEREQRRSAAAARRKQLRRDQLSSRDPAGVGAEIAEVTAEIAALEQELRAGGEALRAIGAQLREQRDVRVRALLRVAAQADRVAQSPRAGDTTDVDEAALDGLEDALNQLDDVWPGWLDEDLATGGAV